MYSEENGLKWIFVWNFSLEIKIIEIRMQEINLIIKVG
jgi:hypothetical protein